MKSNYTTIILIIIIILLILYFINNLHSNKYINRIFISNNKQRRKVRRPIILPGVHKHPKNRIHKEKFVMPIEHIHT